MNKTYLITAPMFSWDCGGCLVLYYLCKLLRDLGETAYLIPRPRNKRLWKQWHRNAKRSGFGEHIWKKDELTNEVVIYPEIIHNNPKNAKNVVRYLLHKPGFHINRKINYGESDLIIGYREAFTTKEFPITDKNCVTIEYTMDDVYYQTNFGERLKTCYMVRKGKNLKLHPNDAICLDGKSHQEIAKIFNECDKFICYDTDTYFAYFAVRCGCKSIVIPNKGVSKKEWRPNVKETYGIAYGLDDIKYAEQTKDKFWETQKEIKSNSIKAVKKFIKLCENNFLD